MAMNAQSLKQNNTDHNDVLGCYLDWVDKKEMQVDLLPQSTSFCFTVKLLIRKRKQKL